MIRAIVYAVIILAIDLPGCWKWWLQDHKQAEKFADFLLGSMYAGAFCLALIVGGYGDMLGLLLGTICGVIIAWESTKPDEQDQ